MIVEGGDRSMRKLTVVVRPFEPERDGASVKAAEEMWEAEPSGGGGKTTLLTHLSHPASRVSNSPCYLMLIAETAAAEENRVVVGVIRGSIKCATRGGGKEVELNGNDGTARHQITTVVTKLAYILGLRVSPFHRRKGIALKLVQRMEEWFREQGAEYSYMATTKSNDASVRLFTERCSYSKFRTPSILVHPVHSHRLRHASNATILRLPHRDAETLYRARFASTEFFPHDIDSVLGNPLSVGTFLASSGPIRWRGADTFLADAPESWAVLSVWNCNEVFRMEVRGAPPLLRWAAAASRIADRAMPWLGIPSVPDLFRPFGIYFLYGIGGEGPRAAGLLRALYAHAHDLTRDARCAVVAAEVAACEPLRAGIPHWRRMSVAEDLWCVKRLASSDNDDSSDWTKSLPPPSIFVDPRDL